MRENDLESTQVRNTRKRPREVNGRTLWPVSFRILSMYPDRTNPTDRPHHYPVYISTLLQEVMQFDDLGLRLDTMVNIKAAVSSIQEKANKAHCLVLAVSYSLHYDKNHSNPTICSSPIEMLNLWKSSSHTSSYTPNTYKMRHNIRHYRLASTSHSTPPCMSMDIPQHYFLKQVFPPCTSHKICNLHNLDSGCTPPPPPQCSISPGVYGSHCCKQCLWMRLKTACRML